MSKTPVSECAVINITAIQKRIEELEYKLSNEKESEEPLQYLLGEFQGQIRCLKQILSQSTPLIPEIEKTFDAGFHKGYNVGQADAKSHPLALTIANHIHKDRQTYISNLKLDI